MISMNHRLINIRIKNNTARTVIPSYFLIFILSVSLFLITGCKSEGTGILGKQSVATSTEDPLLQYAPFAFDYAADTISYNSCVLMDTQDPVALHGLRIGTSEGFVDDLGTGAVKSGVKLRSDFLQYVGKNFTPDYPSNTITPAQIMKILNTSYSIFNSNAFLQFAIRRRADYTVIPDLIMPPNPAPAEVSRDAIVFPQSLGTGYLGYSLTKNVIFNSNGTVLAEGSRTYDLSETPGNIPIVGSFNLNAAKDSTSSGQSPAPYPTEPYANFELYSQQVRDAFNTGTRILTATFGGTDKASGVYAEDSIGNTINNIKRPYRTGTTVFDTARAFGRGYNLKFDSQTSALGWPKNRLINVTELDLSTGIPAGGTSWSCEQFPIADPTHWNNTRPSNPKWVKDSTMVEPNCAPLLAEDTTCTIINTPDECAVKNNRAGQVKRIRRQYSEGHWNIGLMFVARPKSGYVAPTGIGRIFNTAGLPIDLCVSPKAPTTPSCYLPTTGTLSGTSTTPADPTLDIGIQYDRTQDCYLTMNPFTGDHDDARKKGRCAQYASICTRTSSSY